MDNMLSVEQLIYSGQILVRSEQIGLSTARTHIRKVASELSLDAENTSDLLLAVGEAVANAYVHGTPDLDNGFIYLEWNCDGEFITFTVKDQGYSPKQKPKLRECSHIMHLGYGIELMRSTMDEVDVHFNDGTTVILRKRITSIDSLRRKKIKVLDYQTEPS